MKVQDFQFTQQNNDSQKTVVNGDCHNLCFEIEMFTLWYLLMLYNGLYLCSLSRSQNLLQFVVCHIQVDGAGFAVVPDEKQSIFIVICMGAPKYVEYLLVWLDIFSKSVKFELSRILICVLKVLKIHM
jgi:hypothetical protein